MYLFSLILCLSYVLLVTSAGHGPAHVPTKGAVWPKPKTQTCGEEVFTFDPEQFHVDIRGKYCKIVEERVRHYIYEIRNLKSILRNKNEELRVNNMTERIRAMLAHLGPEATKEGIHGLQVHLSPEASCETHPYLNMDESYELVVDSNTTLTSSSVWGIMRGLETFSQLFYVTDDLQEIRIQMTTISDSPAYKHRGLLLDTSRHYIPVKDILKTLDAMAMNKLNVFHWHIVDDQSFPYESETFPGLSRLGAYHESMVYTKPDVENIIEYAANRGIRVIPEFDVPGHTQSWGVAYPNILTKCENILRKKNLGPMNPVRNNTYKFLRSFYNEVQNVFKDDHIHVGGDEVELDCWRSNSEILTWMTENNMTDVKKLHGYFMSRLLPMLKAESKSIVWQEVFEEGVQLPNDTLIQVWKDWNNPEWLMYQALKAGYKVLFSSYWYLDHLGDDFAKMLRHDPRQLLSLYRRRYSADNVDLNNVIGGEACMWAERVDETNLHSRVWPRASAAAERLWSGPPVDLSEGTMQRIEEHTCRMKRRGIPASPPTGPGFCLY